MHRDTFVILLQPLCDNDCRICPENTASMRRYFFSICSGVAIAALLASCHKDHDLGRRSGTITIENVLNSKPLVESGAFQGSESQPLIMPGQSASITFSAAKNQRLTFATMYGWSNDLFFAPENPGIALYQEDGSPITGDVSASIKLWDNGTRVNQVPGAAVVHPGQAETTPKNIKEVTGTDDYGNAYAPAGELLKATLAYNGNSEFTLTIKNESGGTANETPFSPGVWAISYVAGGSLLLPAPVYTADQPTANGLTHIAEAGDNAAMHDYLTDLTGIFTPLSPVLVVVYRGEENPFYKTGEKDRGEGLKELAQKGNAGILAEALRTKPEVKAVYVLKDPKNTVLLPRIGDMPGGSVSQPLTLNGGDRVAIATMYGFSNDWFFASTGNGAPSAKKGDLSATMGLFDDGTAINQFPGAGITQFNLAGTPLQEDKPIAAVSNPNAFTTLPPVNEMIKVTLE
jgi:hypothetical protein